MANEIKTIAILDDEPDRIAAMIASLVDQCPGYQTAVFDNAPDFVSWLMAHCRDTALICLDHDLGPNRSRDGVTFDPGIGRDVVDYLATQTPSCPVIVHTTNSLAAPGMIQLLEETGWTASRVSPYADLEWIAEVWIDEVRRAVKR